MVNPTSVRGSDFVNRRGRPPTAGYVTAEGWPFEPTGRSRLVCYSLVVDEHRLADHELQFELSVASLRSHNSSVPVVLFMYGELPPSIESICRTYRVMVHWQGSYEERLRATCPAGASALAHYPVLHKNLNFAELATTGVKQALVCDLDTIFFEDVDVLLDRYATADVVAREEVYSRRSIHGVDPTFIDEVVLAGTASAMGRAFVAPFNLGMVLYSRRAIVRLADSMRILVDDAWRLCCGLALGADSAAWSLPWIATTRDVLSEADAARALPYPSSNAWLIEEVALWLTLGATPGLTIANLSPDDVAQNGEILSRTYDDARWLACHYFSQNLPRVLKWLCSMPTERVGNLN